MKTYLECIPCFFRQALEASKLAGASPAAQRRVLNELAKTLPVFSLAGSPPEMGRIIYGVVSRIAKKKDPYAQIKTHSNKKALRLYPRLKKKIERSPDRLQVAVELAIAGNIIDYGVKNSLNVGRELRKIMAAENRLMKNSRAAFRYARFRHSLDKAKSLLYLADNAGEVVFDRLLIEEIKKRDSGKRIFYAVKSRPSINDALIGDAKMCGIGPSAEIITNGSDAPGTVLSLCSSLFRRLFRTADMVISKGQGNFESLSAVVRPVFFLFMVKCPVVADHIGGKIGDIILRYHSGVKKRQ